MWNTDKPSSPPSKDHRRFLGRRGVDRSIVQASRMRSRVPASSWQCPRVALPREPEQRPGSLDPTTPREGTSILSRKVGEDSGRSAMRSGVLSADEPGILQPVRCRVK